MVYCGKPSMGCAQCRAKRTKVSGPHSAGFPCDASSRLQCLRRTLCNTQCDTLRPYCGQCTRAGRICSGYRDPLQLLFRDQTPSLTNKKPHQVSPVSGSSSRINVSPPRTQSRAESEISDVSWPAATISPSLSESIETQATCFFFRNYVWEDSQSSKGFFDYLPRIFGRNETMGSALTDAIMSLGMVGLSNTKHASEIMIPATEKYHSALRATNSALRDVEQAKADQTLITVMLLGLYEVAFTFVF